MLNELISLILFSFFRLENNRLTGALQFFLYDTIKIIVILFIMILAVGFLRTYLPKNKIKQWLSKKSSWGYLGASLFGAVTPFCSCSSIPIFLSFLQARISLGIAFSFLITSPLINEYLVAMMWGFFGWKITLAYIMIGIGFGVVAGIILGKMRLEQYLVSDLRVKDKEVNYVSIKQRILFGYNEAFSITKKLWIWVVAGVGLAAVIHNYIPTDLVHSIIGGAGIFAVPIAVLLGVPMYASCAAILPIAFILFTKGVPLGTALAFMMATAALSLPEAVILRRAMHLKLILIFFGIVAIGIMMIGYFLNFLQSVLV